MDQEQSTQEISHLTQEWIDAERHGDAAFLERALADDFMAVGPLGFMLTKQQWIGRHQTGDLQYHALSLDEITVRAYGEAAILVGRQVQDAAFRGNPVGMGQLRTTVVLVRQQGAWRLASVHMSAIGQPPGAGRPAPQGR